MKKNQLITIICTIITLFCSTIAAGQNKEIDLTFKMPSHPRLLISHELEEQILDNVKRDAKFNQIHQAIVSEADHVLNKPVLERVMIGKRLLGVCQSEVKMKTWSTDPVTDYDAKNLGTSIVGFEVRLKADSKQAISVFLDAGKPSQKNFSAKPIGSWPKK